MIRAWVRATNHSREWAVGQVLDVLDYISNFVLMPVGAMANCVLIGWALGPKSARLSPG